MESAEPNGGTLKMILSAVLFLQVLVFSQLPYLYPKATTSKIVMTIFNNFSTGLFLGIAFLHMIPEANLNISENFMEGSLNGVGGHSHGHSHSLPYGSLVAVLTFLLILTLESSFHSHDQHERKNHLMKNVLEEKSQERKKMYIETILVQFALSLHCFFECMSIGIERNPNIVMTLGIAVCVHKWAEALTLGYAYYATGMSRIEALKFSLFHSALNASAVIIGYYISQYNSSLTGIFNGIAGGTFLYVCFVEKIGKNFKDKSNVIVNVGLILMGLAFTIVIG